MSNFPLSGPLSSGLVNESNSHISNPGFSSKVGAVTGCGGSGTELALQQKGIYQMKQAGGKRMKKHRSKKHKKSSKKRVHKSRRTVRRKRRIHRGGYGHGFAKVQPSDMNGNATHLSYSSLGQNSDTNMEASKQHNLTGGARKRKSHNKRNSHTKGKKTSNKRRPVGKKRRSHRQRGGYSQYMSNVANAHNYSLGGELTSKDSALASPPPFTPHNDCLNSWKHLGDTEPYNKIIA